MTKHELLKLTDEAAELLAPDSPREQVVRLLDLRQLLRAYADRLIEASESAVIRWIEKNGEISVGTVRYYIGTSHTTKCVDNLGAMRAVLKAVGGDDEDMARFMVSGAFKPGACREVIPGDEYADLFRTTTRTELREGKPVPVRGLQKADTRFIEVREEQA